MRQGDYKGFDIAYSYFYKAYLVESVGGQYRFTAESEEQAKTTIDDLLNPDPKLDGLRKHFSL